MKIVLSALVLLFSEVAMAHAYIGPGAGFAFLSSFVVLFVSVFLVLISIFSWPIRATILFIKRRKIKRDSKVRRMVIIGFDGLDPELCQKYIKQGKLPHMAKLQKNGSFRPLQTTMPALSPVAWSTFATGVNPGKHGIFDFFTRDPQTYQPVLSSAKISTSQKTFKLGSFRFPFGNSTAVELRRKSQSFWSVLGKHKIFSTILRVPITFPPEKFYGACLSAMCTPDLRGTQGSFTLYTTKISGAGNKDSKGSIIPLNLDGNLFESKIEGPVTKKNGSDVGLSIPIRGEIDPQKQMVKLWVGNEDIRLSPGIYSPWQKLKFSAGWCKPVYGIVKFLVTQIEPHLNIYMTPINIDPEKPTLPISHPRYYSICLAKLHGPFSTLGLAEDTWALNEGIIDEGAFLAQTYDFHEERKTLLLDNLRRNKEGLTVLVFDTTDRIQHMFFRYLSDDHPSNTGKDTSVHKHAVEEAYACMDTLVGRVMREIGSRDLLMVISDHGFKPFKWGINLNTWLWKKGYLVLKEGQSPGKEWFENVDWSKTRAFAYGLAGIFINTCGREKFGIVQQGNERETLAAELKENLENLFDKKNACKPIRRVVFSQQNLTGPYTSEAPDLLIGYETGYRASWNCATGKITEAVIEPNTKRWSGDHSIDPNLVPGVFFSNWKLKAQAPALIDIAPTVLNLFGIEKQRFQDGRVLDLSPSTIWQGEGENDKSTGIY
jgi:predicted AlkP superfamily phosphohydrolase/phosphomutase